MKKENILKERRGRRRAKAESFIGAKENDSLEA